jgi:hypothetical protein
VLERGHLADQADGHLAEKQGLTLLHFSAEVQRSSWDRGCSKGLFRGCSGGHGTSGGV